MWASVPRLEQKSALSGKSSRKRGASKLDGVGIHLDAVESRFFRFGVRVSKGLSGSHITVLMCKVNKTENRKTSFSVTNGSCEKLLIWGFRK